jgi:hypothetical protein
LKEATLEMRVAVLSDVRTPHVKRARVWEELTEKNFKERSTGLG